MTKILIFTCAYNAEKTLKRTIDCILNQTFTDWKYHILNNASTDRTGEIIAQYAASDPRISTSYRKINDMSSTYGLYFKNLMNATKTEWLCFLDADDEYAVNFLEKIYNFSISYDLDLAACGYEKIDSISGEILKRKAMEENLILEGADFVDKFIEYRGFTIALWVKLFSIRVVESALCQEESINQDGCFLDGKMVLDAYLSAEHVGILGGCYYKYYRYSHSLSNLFNPNRFKWDINYFNNIKKYLLTTEVKYQIQRKQTNTARTDKLNRDFLYAILFSLVEESMRIIRGSDVPWVDKLTILIKYFQDRDIIRMFHRDADPQFRNLAARAEFIHETRDWALTRCLSEETDGEAYKLAQQLGSILGKMEYKK
jgi:glycosyltransferase involved in cell wall biosynthesis